MLKAIKKFFGIQTDAEKFQAGVDYVNSVFARVGSAGMHDMSYLWEQCDCAFDRTPFDAGIRSRLCELNVPDAMDLP